VRRDLFAGALERLQPADAALVLLPRTHQHERPGARPGDDPGRGHARPAARRALLERVEVGDLVEGQVGHLGQAALEARDQLGRRLDGSEGDVKQAFDVSHCGLPPPGTPLVAEWRGG
jgi:hypothetical protein